MIRQQQAAIVGVYEYPLRVTNASDFEIKAVSALHALRDAGLSLQQVDAIFDSAETGVLAGYAFAEYLGVRASGIDMVDVGGSSFEFLAGHAVQMIRAGKARIVLITYGSTARSTGTKWGTSGGVRATGEKPSVTRNMEIPWGLNTVANYAMVARRHMHQYGTTEAQLAEIAVTSRRHALRNPDAVRGLKDIGFKQVEALTAEGVINSPLVADPLHRLDCCLVTDGGGAVVIAAADVVKDTRTRPIWIIGTGEAIGYTTNRTDITLSAASISGPRAMEEAGIAPDDLDIAMIYDSFTITVLVALEDLGFCKKGEGGEYVSGGKLNFDSPGAPALNTDGGGLSSNHPGRRGLFLLIEAVRQLRGESTAQVPNASAAIAHGTGGLLATRHSAATVVLARG
jgi:acetyl-CoA C-acetyltransferase